MSIHLAPSPVALAARHGAGLRASAEAVQSVVHREVALTLKVCGPLAAWALVDGRFPDQPDRLVNWGVIEGRLGESDRDRFRRISARTSQLHPVLSELAADLPDGHNLGVAFHGPAGALGHIADLMRGNETMSFISSHAGERVRVLSAAATELVDTLLESTGVTHLHVATDGSVQRGRRGAGAGWVDSWGRFGYDLVDTREIVVAEVVAIANALTDMPRGVTKVTVRVDSRDAIAIAQQALEHGSTSGPVRIPAKAHHAATKIHEVGKKIPVDIDWVRGHSGDLMNETADRLAVMVRRTCQAGLQVETAEEVAARIMGDYYAAANGDGGHAHLAAAA